MTTITLSPEQEAIVAAARETKDNLLISALAGAAKTTTLLEIARALPRTQILSLAFNKKIADEMKAKLPKNCTCKTLHSVGLAAWTGVIGKRLNLWKTKKYGILSDAIKDTADEETSEALFKNMPFLLQSLGKSKSAGHIPDAFYLAYEGKECARLQDDDDFFASLEEEPTPAEQRILLQCLTESLNLAFDGTVDFDDQLLLPTVFRAHFPPNQLVLVDEAQDLSELNHAMLAKLTRRRIIAVGDQCQAIYAFRGAHESGMAQLRQLFDMRDLHLTCSFRCPEPIVEHVRWRAPEMKSWPGNPNNAASALRWLDQDWSPTDFPPNCAIICRNNAPLLGLALRLLGAGQNPNIWGNDIAAGLIKDLKSFGEPTTPSEDAIDEMYRWANKKRKKLRCRHALEDRIACFLVFLNQYPSLGAAINAAQDVFRREGRINLMTGHKAKGHEFDEVYFLNESLVGEEGQERNLRYVICTRSKRNLTYIETGDSDDT